jgi:two-component system, NtrC family, response regulator HydG
MPSILIVDDLVSIHEMLAAVIQPTGLTPAFATDGEQALNRYRSERFDVVLADLDMRPMDGLTLLRSIKGIDPNSVVIIMTAYASTENAIQALKYGAFDFLQKPFKIDELLKTLRRALEFRQSAQDQPATTAAAPAVVAAGDWESQLVTRSPAMQRLVQQIKRLISAKSAVLLQGEPGTGKRQMAELLHSAANPAGGAPFVRVDCTHSTDADFRPNLVGEKNAGGAWIGSAKGGTLFLDNISSLPPEMQRALVSVLKSAGQSFRLICSCTEDLEPLVDEGKFDDALFYRVASLPVHLPPLRERREDIPVLVKEIVQRTVHPSFNSGQIEFTEDAMQVLCGHYWPGNVPELNQVVSKVVTTSENRTISARQLPMRLREHTDWPSLADYLAAQEKDYIASVLNACQNDKAKALRILKCDPGKLG